MTKTRLLAIDPSLTCTGWACFALESGKLLGVGKIKALGPELPLASRLSDLQERVTIAFEGLQLKPQDILICEAETTMKDPQAVIKVERVRGIFEAVARAKGLVVPGRIHPRSVQHELMGLRGKQLERHIVKDTALQVAKHLFAQAFKSLDFDPGQENLSKNQDIVDAVLIGHLALTWIQTGRQGGLSLETIFERARKGRR